MRDASDMAYDELARETRAYNARKDNCGRCGVHRTKHDAIAEQKMDELRKADKPAPARQSRNFCHTFAEPRF